MMVQGSTLLSSIIQFYNRLWVNILYFSDAYGTHSEVCCNNSNDIPKEIYFFLKMSVWNVESLDVKPVFSSSELMIFIYDLNCIIKSTQHYFILFFLFLQSNSGID